MTSAKWRRRQILPLALASYPVLRFTIPRSSKKTESFSDKEDVLSNKEGKEVEVWEKQVPEMG